MTIVFNDYKTKKEKHRSTRVDFNVDRIILDCLKDTKCVRINKDSRQK